MQNACSILKNTTNCKRTKYGFKILMQVRKKVAIFVFVESNFDNILAFFSGKLFQHFSSVQ